jgi:fructose-1,6-bisphosphatase/inositol monophosphatase family enzyme
MDLVHLKNIAIEAALAAGKVIQKYMNEEVAVEKKQGGTSYASQVVTEVDKACETVILSHLLPSCKRV